MRTSLLLWLVVSGCFLGTQGEVLTSRDGGASDSGLDDGGVFDASVADAGQVTRCDARAQADAWPVRIVLGLEAGGPMCVIDPPGYQDVSGFCSTASLGTLFPDGGFLNRRSSALQMLDAQTFAPSVQVAVARYGNFRTFGLLEFFSPSPGRLSSMANNLVWQSNDMQAVLEGIKFDLEAQIQKTPVSERALTNYEVVLLSSGIPYPRCAANDSLPSNASPEHPDGIWKDDVREPNTGFLNPNCIDWGIPPYDWCTAQNWVPPLSDAGVALSDGGFIFHSLSACDFLSPDADYNQNHQLIELVDAIVSLKASYGLGEVKVHTVLNFDQTQLKTCGVLCTYLFYPYPTTSVRPAGKWLLQQLAQHGHGVFIDPPDLSPIDLTNLQSLQPLNGICR